MGKECMAKKPPKSPPKNVYLPKDRLFHRAKEVGLRSRAGFKLIELNQKLKIIQLGDFVIDLGSAPGAWSQVAADLIGSKGKVFSIDLEALKQTSSLAKNIYFFQGDIQNENTLEKLKDLLSQHDPPKVQVVLSDLSPKLSGIHQRDHLQSIHLARDALTIAQKFLQKSGNFLVKVFPGEELESFRKEVAHQFSKEKLLHLESSRRTSKEGYICATGFNGHYESNS